MVSKPTGRKQGRPKKMAVAPSPKLDPWRPKKPFAQNPDRWNWALLERHIRAGRLWGRSKLTMHHDLAKLRYGAIIRTPENLAKFESAQPFLVWMPPHEKFKIAASDTLTERSRGGWPWRQADPFRPIADDERRELSRIRKLDGRRLDIMVGAWEAAKCGDFDEARRLAQSIDDLEAFEKDLASRRIP